jgi:ATP-dependent Clp protease ATP-binding subunit ClpC
VFERFTDGARRAVVLAQEEAVRLRHAHIGAEHLLLGVLRCEQGAGPAAMEELGIRPDGLRAAVAREVPAQPDPPSGHIPFTPEAKIALEGSLRQAIDRGSDLIESGHLLLALVEDPRRSHDRIAPVLAGIGVEPRELAAAARRRLGGRSPTPAPAAMPAPPTTAALSGTAAPPTTRVPLARIEAMLAEILVRLERIEARLDDRPEAAPERGEGP